MLRARDAQSGMATSVLAQGLSAHFKDKETEDYTLSDSNTTLLPKRDSGFEPKSVWGWLHYITPPPQRNVNTDSKINIGSQEVGS